jgi:heptosyltransferase-2
MRESPQRIVVYSPNWLGDAVMALPAIADIRRHFGAATLAVAASERLDELFRSVTGVDDVVTLRSTHANARGRAGDFAATLREGRYDLAILLPNSIFSALVTRRAGIPERWGYRTRWRGKLLTRVVQPPSCSHQATYYRDLTSRLGIDQGPTTTMLTAPVEGRAAAQAMLAAEGLTERDRFIAMAPGAANGTAKQWPPSRFAELAILLADRASANVVLVGTKGDLETADRIARAIEGRAGRLKLLNLVGRTSLAELMGVISRCDQLVTNDSGSMHLASALGRKVVAIFGATDERRTAPIAWDDAAIVHEIVTGEAWCRPCLLHECPTDHRCMTSIAPSAVLARCLEAKVAGSGQVA